MLSTRIWVYRQKPYWWTDAVPAPAPDPGRRPRLYVYEMRVHDAAWLFAHGRHLDWQEPFFLVERALSCEFRTADGEQADFFLVPLFFRWHRGRLKHLQSAIAYIAATWPFWNRTNGADHIFLTNDDWGNCEMDPRAHGFGAAELAVPITLSLWGYTRNMWGGIDRPCFVPGKDIALPPKMTPDLYPLVPYWASDAGGAGGNLTGNSTGNSTSMPAGRSGSGGSGGGGEESGEYLVPDGSDGGGGGGGSGPVPPGCSGRDLLLYFIGYPGPAARPRNAWEPPHTWSFGARQRMFELWEGLEDSTGIRLERPGPGGAIEGFLEGMACSVFCFAPAGWGWAMRTTQALQAGCIPVIIQPNVTQPLEHDLLDWDKFSVKLSMDDIPMIDKILRAISAEEIARKRAAMRDVWMRFVWTSPQLNPLELQPHRMTAGDARKLAESDVFASIMEILRLRLEKKQKAKMHQEEQEDQQQEQEVVQEALSADEKEAPV